MRFLPALAVALLPLASVAQTDEWVRDDMSDESLWLLRTGNLAREAPRAATLPGAPDGGSHWVMSKGDGAAYVVYFIPGRIHEVEIDTHRLAGASGDFTLAVSTDGKLYQPLDAGAVLLDTSFGWDYRLMASDQIPENATHLLVQFPDGSTAHGLSEVWIRYSWDDALVSRFLPEPFMAPQQQDAMPAQSDAGLQMMLDPLVEHPAEQPALEVFPLVEQTPAPSLPAFVAEPFRAPHSVESVAPSEFESVNLAENATAAVALEAGPDTVGPDATPVGSDALALETQNPAPLDDETHAPAPAENSEILIDLDPENTSAAEETPEQGAPLASTTTTIDVALFEKPIEPTPEVSAPPSELGDGSTTPEMTNVSVTIDIPQFLATGESREPSPEVLLQAGEEPAAEISEEVIVLPTFTLPVFVSAKAEEVAQSPQFEPQPQATADMVVLVPAIETAGNPPSRVSVPASDRIDTKLDTQPAVEASRDPAPPVETVPPIQAAARIEPIAAEPIREFEEDEESDSKPVLKMRRTGPRSKSRGTYVPRG